MSTAPALHVSQARFYELDILRGMAAIMVVIYHYKHFLLINEDLGFDYGHLPFSQVLLPVYIYGQSFVELFFSISGYVFFWLYADAVESRRADAKSFFIARFARLYPLYFVTLIYVAAMQLAFHQAHGADYIYKGNSIGNFLLNLLMVQQWIPAAPQSFNGPAWSISVEIFLYLVFFLVCYFRRNTILILTCLCLAGVIYKSLRLFDPNDFARGMPSFFLGGLIYYAVKALREDHHAPLRRWILWGLAMALPVMWIVAYVRGNAIPPPVAPTGLADRLLSTEMLVYVVFPLTLLGLGLMQDRWKTEWLGRQKLHAVSWIGDVSYSIYLIHFPIQLTIMYFLAGKSFAERATLFSSPWAFFGFMAVAMGLALLSHRYFEMPLQRFLRKRMPAWLAGRKAIG